MTEKKINRLPIEGEKGVFPDHPAIKTPWHKLISFHDTHHYACRHISCVAASFMQVLRIIMPDYKERATALVNTNCPRYANLYLIPGMHENHKERHNLPPFVKGTMIGALAGDQGDEANLMAGRVVDYDTYRFEKELDTCPWDIIGSELCRTTVAYFGALANTFGDRPVSLDEVFAGLQGTAGSIVAAHATTDRQARRLPIGTLLDGLEQAGWRRQEPRCVGQRGGARERYGAW